MNLEAIYFLSQVVAAVALVASLVFVGIQIRQVNLAQKREAKRVRELMVNDAMSQMTDNEFGPLFVRGCQGDSTLSDVEVARFNIFANSIILSTRSRFEEFRDGILPEGDWHKMRGNMRFWLTSPGFRACFLLSQSTTRSNPEFDAEFAEALAEPVADIHGIIASEWQAILAELVTDSQQSETFDSFIYELKHNHAVS